LGECGVPSDRVGFYLSQKHRTLLYLWQAWANGGVPSRKYFTPEALRQLLGRLEIFEVEDGGRDFGPGSKRRARKELSDFSPL
jgi:hypothetical protein